MAKGRELQEVIDALPKERRERVEAGGDALIQEELIRRALRNTSNLKNERTDFASFKEKAFQNPAVRKEYEALAEEFGVAKAAIKAGKS